MKIKLDFISDKEFNKWQMDQLNKEDPPAISIIKRVAVKSHICSKCGSEIHKNENYFVWKPRPDYNKFNKKKTYHKWQHRCIDCEPK